MSLFLALWLVVSTKAPKSTSAPWNGSGRERNSSGPPISTPAAKRNSSRKQSQISPAFAAARYNLAVIYLQQKKLDQAVGHLDALIELEPESARGAPNARPDPIRTGKDTVFPRGPGPGAENRSSGSRFLASPGRDPFPTGPGSGRRRRFRPGLEVESFHGPDPHQPGAGISAARSRSEGSRPLRVLSPNPPGGFPGPVSPGIAAPWRQDGKKRHCRNC